MLFVYLMFIGPFIIVIPEELKNQINVSYYFIVLLIGSSLQPKHHSSLTAPNFQSTANQERNDQCGNQHHSRELLMMGIVMPETC